MHRNDAEAGGDPPFLKKTLFKSHKWKILAMNVRRGSPEIFFPSRRIRESKYSVDVIMFYLLHSSSGKFLLRNEKKLSIYLFCLYPTTPFISSTLGIS